MLGTLVQGRVCVSAASVSAAKSALTIAVRYGLRRRQFGPPDSDREVVILDYRTHQRRLMPLLARTYALHFAQARALRAVPRGDERRPGGRRSASGASSSRWPPGLKATTSWHATETIQTCRECCGGAGYMAVNRFAALKADTDIFTTFEGDNTVLLMLTAKGILTDYKDQFSELDPVEMVTFVAGQVAETVVERLFARKIVQVIADAVPSRDDLGDLFDRELQLELFRWREGHILASAAQRFRRGLGDGPRSVRRVPRGPEPRDRRRPRAPGDGRARGVRGRRSRPARTAAPSATPSRSSATCTRSRRSRPTRASSRSTAGCPGRAASRSRAR